MSQRSAKRNRKQTDEDEDAEFKAPPIKTNNETDIMYIHNVMPAPELVKAIETKIESNGTEKEKGKETDKEQITRSRSNTPQKKKKLIRKSTESNGSSDLIETQQNIPISPTENGANNIENKNDKELETTTESDSTTEVDPLLVVVSDEPDPELVFDENSDLESGKGSPIMTRCKTRRSQTRNIPTPKTPKSIDEQESDKAPVEPTIPEVLETDCDLSEKTGKEEKPNDDDDNQDFIVSDEFLSLEEDYGDDILSPDISVRAEVGGDSTRLNFTEKNFSLLEESNFLSTSKKQSLVETLRGLSARRAIRPLNDSYCKRLLKVTRDKSDLNIDYPSRNSVERVSISSKRKRCSESSDDAKRFKRDSPRFLRMLTSPLNSIKNSFKPNVNASTPKLTGYKDNNFLIEDENNLSQKEEIYERKWCTIM